VFETLKRYDRKLDIISNYIKRYGNKKPKKDISTIEYDEYIEINKIENWKASDSKIII